MMVSPKSLTDVDTQALVDQKISGLENMVAKLDSTSSKLRTSILDLKTRRNLCAAIGKLPAEIIVEIILEGKRDAQGQSIFAERGYLNIAGACRSWRAIALSTPRLWSSIDVTSVHPDGCLEMLSRSESVPLHVRYTPQTHDLGVIQRYDAAAAAVMSQLGRIRTLEITTVTGANPPFRHFPLHPNVNAHSLQVLRLTCQGSGPGIILYQCSAMPSLRIMDLHNVTLGTNFSPLPSSLTHLEIVLPSLPSFRGQPISQLLRCLQNASNIETISIIGLILEAQSLLPPPTLAKIALPKLSYLNISSPHISASTIFDHLRHSPSTCIYFTCPAGYFQPAELDSLKRAVSHFAARGAMSITGARITVTDGKQVEVVIHASQPLISLSKRFKFTIPFSRPDMVNILMQLWAVIPLADAPSLAVSGFFVDWLSPEWLRLLQLFSGVKYLRFRRCSEAMLRGLLGADDAHALPLLKVRKIHFDQCGCEGDGPRPNDKMWAVMRQLLSERSELGISVEFYWDGVHIPSPTGKTGPDSKFLDGDTMSSVDEEGEGVNLEQCVTFY